MASATLETLKTWRRNVVHRGAWKRGMIVGLIAGSIQAMLHQGNAWLHLAVDASVVLKTILSLCVAVAVALSAVAVASRPDDPPPSTTSE